MGKLVRDKIPEMASEDCISRQRVLELIETLSNTDATSARYLLPLAEVVKTMPKVVPEKVRLPSKFKDTSALVKAYECLEKEYTRKAQKLKEFQLAAANHSEEVSK